MKNAKKSCLAENFSELYQIFSCEICWIEYKENTCIPTIIPGGHTLSCDCLESLPKIVTNYKYTFSCPFCKNHFRLTAKNIRIIQCFHT